MLPDLPRQVDDQRNGDDDDSGAMRELSRRDHYQDCSRRHRPDAVDQRIAAPAPLLELQPVSDHARLRKRK